MKLRLLLLSVLLSLFCLNDAFAQSFQIAPVEDQIVAYPNALLLPLQIKGYDSAANVEYSYQSNIDDAIIKGQSLYWKPDMNDAGKHRIKIIAETPSGQSDTETFIVQVQPFNAPPRIIPIRQITIPVGIPYNLPITAVDPDGMNKDLIRYLGVGLPKGASINEQTGTFRWTPTARQTGKSTFRVIATDQYGAASSIDVTIRVIKIDSKSG